MVAHILWEQRVTHGLRGAFMVDQLPNLGRESEMLNAMGMTSLDELFNDVPEDVRITQNMNLPDPQTEEEILADAKRILGANIAISERISFLGAGIYRNFVPASVMQLINRGEFLTSYTPYQPEVSQGMLQAMWEFQTLICELVGLPVANLSVYDGSSAAAEALTCAVRVHNRKASQKNTLFVSELTPPDRLSVIHNYIQGAGITLKYLRHGSDGCLDMDSIAEAAGSCGVYVEQPNPLGILDQNLVDIKSIIGDDTAFIVGVQPTSLGVIEAPGNYGADIVVGEGQPLGSPMTAGGPIYGIFSCSQKYLRQMPGRIVGKTIDVDGNEAFCLTLSTREQHIRRHRATSNLCTNETLIALMGAMHMALLGPEGIRDLALRNMAACQLAKNKLLEIDTIKSPHIDSFHYNEFIIELPGNTSDCLEYLDSKGVIGGFDLSNWYPEQKNRMLVTCTDQTSVSEIELLAAHLSVWSATMTSGVKA